MTIKNLPFEKKLVFGVIAIAIIGSLMLKKSYLPKANNPGDNSNEETNHSIGVNQTLHSKYFDVIVKKAETWDRIETGNQFADKNPKRGETFLVLYASFTNTDDETRTIDDGELILIQNGKSYTLEKSEHIMAEGWGILLQQVNPLSTFETKIVYSIPENFKGQILYRPSRSDERIFIANL